MEHIIRIGMDTSKHIFQLHGVTAAEEPALRKKLRRKGMVTFFQQLAPTVWTLLTKVETSCDRILIAGGANVEAEWEQGPAV